MNMNTPENRARQKLMARDLVKGMLPKVVAKKYGVSLRTVYDGAMRRGAPINGRVTVPSPRSFLVLKRLLDGVPPPAIAKEFRITATRVRVIANKAREAGFIIPRKGKKEKTQ